MQVVKASPRFLRKLFSAGFIVVLGLAFVLFTFTPQAVHATATVVQTKASSAACAGATCTLTFASNPTAGNLIVVVCAYVSTTNPTFTSVASTGDGTFLVGISQVTILDGTAVYVSAEEAYKLSSTGGATTAAVTCTLSGAASGGAYMFMAEVSGGAGNVWSFVSQGQSTSSGTGGKQTTTFLTFPGSSFIMAGVPHHSGATTFTPGTGFSALSDAGDFEDSEYGTDVTVVTPTYCPSTLSGGAGTNGVVVVCGAYTTTTTSGIQMQTIGSCPASNSATFTMVNNTIYFYYGNALASEVVNTISTSVSSTVGSGSHTLQLLLYVSSTITASPGTPLLKVFASSFVLTSGTTKQVITAQVNVQLNAANTPISAGNLFGVGVVGDDHIKLNQSSTSGLFTQTGAASTASQPNSFTSTGTSVATKLYLCAVGSYQGAVTRTITSTQAATTSVTTTISTTQTTLDATVLLTNNGTWPIILLLLTAPAVLFAKIAGFGGAFIGFSIGVVLCVLIGLLPFYAVLVFILSIVAFLVTRPSGGGGPT